MKEIRASSRDYFSLIGIAKIFAPAKNLSVSGISIYRLTQFGVLAISIAQRNAESRERIFRSSNSSSIALRNSTLFRRDR